MDLSSLKTLLPGKREEKKEEYFLALELGGDLIKAALWVENEKVIIKALSRGKTVEEAVEKLREKKGGDLAIQKVIFGLPPDFVEKDKIKKEPLRTLKEISKSLSLSPLGFVVIPEAIAHLLEIEEETPQTALLVGIRKEKLTFSLFRGGQSKKEEEIKRTKEIYADVKSGLAKFSEEEVLPSKIILYNEEEELSETREELLSYPWQKNERFLHVPKIQTLPWDFSIKAVVEAGVSELKKKDVHLIVEETKEEEPEEKAEELGFVTEKDIIQELEKEKSKIPLEEKKPLRLPSFSLPEIRLPQVKWPLLALVVALTVVFGGVAIASFYFYPQAKINLIADPKVFSKQIKATLNTNIEKPNIKLQEIPGKIYSLSLSGEETAETSGKKTIGEPSRGEVTIYNKTTSSKTFKKATVLTGAENLKFILDEEITVASASDTGVSLEYGKQKTRITAERIGPAGNLKAESEFTLDDFPSTSYLGRNEIDFSGGTEREITAVSLEDQEKLLTKVTEKLKNEAREEFKKKISSEEKFLEESARENILEKVFDKEVGDEADNLTLKLTLEFAQTSYKEEDLNQFLEDFIAEQVPPDFEYHKEKSFLEVVKSELREDGSVAFTANYKAYLLPKIDLLALRKKLLGKSASFLENEIQNMVDKGIIGYQLVIKRKLPFFSNKLPLWERNIKLEVAPY